MDQVCGPPRPPEPAAQAPVGAARPERRAEGVAPVRAELAQRGRQHGHVGRPVWQAACRRLAAHGASAADRDGLRAELARTATEEGWVFPDEVPPDPDPSRRRDVLVAKARQQAACAPVISADYLSALLALGCGWGIAHEELAQALARYSVAEHWAASWDPACAMDGLLGAERARQRRQTAREQLLADVERPGQPGWRSARDQTDRYAGLREQGLAHDEAWDLLAGLRGAAEARGWAGADPVLRPVQRVLDPAAQQAARARRVVAAWRPALVRRAARAADCLRAWARPQLTAGVLRVAPVLVVLGAELVSPRPLPAPGPPADLALAPLVVATPVVVPPAPEPTRSAPAQQPFVVANTDGLGARLRSAPKTGAVERALREGTVVVRTGPDVQVDGMAWTPVRAPDGTPGWMAADLLEPAAAEPDNTGRESAQGARPGRSTS